MYFSLERRHYVTFKPFGILRQLIIPLTSIFLVTFLEMTMHTFLHFKDYVKTTEICRNHKKKKNRFCHIFVALSEYMYYINPRFDKFLIFFQIHSDADSQFQKTGASPANNSKAQNPHEACSEKRFSNQYTNCL